MAIPTIGAYTWVGFAEEVVHGTAVARTNYMPVTDFGLQRRAEFEARDHLEYAEATSVGRRGTYQTKDAVNGPVGVIGHYDDSTCLILKHGFRAVVDAGSAPPYTHTYTIGGALALGLTVEGKKGHGANAKSEVFTGCLTSKLTLRIEPMKQLKVVPEYIGRTSAGEASQGTPTFAASAEAIGAQHWGQFTFDGVARPFVSLELTIDNNISERFNPGSLFTALPAPAGFTKVAGRIVVESGDGGDWYAKQLAGTKGVGTVSAAGTGNNAAALTLHSMQLMKRDQTPGGAGIMQETFEFEAFTDGTNWVTLVITNDNANAEDNS